MNNNTDEQSQFTVGFGNSTIGVKLDNIILHEHILQKSLAVSTPKSGDVLLVNNKYDIGWTSTDVNFVNIYYKLKSLSSWNEIVNNLSAGTGKYSWTVPPVQNDSCKIKIEDVENTDMYALSDNIYIKTASGVKENLIPTEYSLTQNYPNPFNPTTKIKFGLPESANTKLIIYDILGRQVKILVNSELSAGYHEVEFNANDLVSGIYFYRIHAKDFISVKKLIIMK